MLDESELRRHSPDALSNARIVAHKAVQLVTKAARANLPAKPDDSHSNLNWESALKGFLSHPLSANGINLSVGISFSPMKLSIFQHDQPLAELIV